MSGICADATSVEALVSKHGINGFYTSIGAREACCAVRKLAPLNRALRGASCWITGLRADQSNIRQGMRFVSHDTARGVLKANPLFDLSRDQVAALIELENIPTNPLHQQGFLSIGCAPCTRAVMPGERGARRPVVVGGRRDSRVRAAPERVRPVDQRHVVTTFPGMPQPQ